MLGREESELTKHLESISEDLRGTFKLQFQKFLDGDLASLSVLNDIALEATPKKADPFQKGVMNFEPGDFLVTLAWLLAQCPLIKDGKVEDTLAEFTQRCVIYEDRSSIANKVNATLTAMMMALPSAIVFSRSGSGLTDLMTISAQHVNLATKNRESFEKARKEDTIPADFSENNKVLLEKCIALEAFHSDILAQIKVPSKHFHQDHLVLATLNKLQTALDKYALLPDIKTLNQYEFLVQELSLSRESHSLKRYLLQQRAAIVMQKVQLRVSELLYEKNHAPSVANLRTFQQSLNDHTSKNDLGAQHRELPKFKQECQDAWNKIAPLDPTLQNFMQQLNALPGEHTLSAHNELLSRKLQNNLDDLISNYSDTSPEYAILNDLCNLLNKGLLVPTLKDALDAHESALEQAKNNLTSRQAQAALSEHTAAIALQKVKLELVDLGDNPQIEGKAENIRTVFLHELSDYTSHSLDKQYKDLVEFRHVCDRHYYKMDKALSTDLKPLLCNLLLLCTGIGTVAAAISIGYRFATGRYGLFDDNKPAAAPDLLEPLNKVIKTR